METYLLLRSNKQSGPYTFQQLVNLGLKPYDLVWVEGKSAAWRYPSEVDMLKSYAPTTEEQPFDRFYKKSEEKQPEEVPQEKVTSKPVRETPVKEIKEEIPVLAVENKIPTSKKVFVSMPGNGTVKKPALVTTATVPVAEPKPVIKEEKIEHKRAEPRMAPITEETNQPVFKDKRIVKEEPVLDEKYSESLDDIKRRYAETYLNRKKRSGWTSTHTSIAQVFGGAIFFCLLVVVVYKNFSGDESSLSRTTVIQPNKKDTNKTPSQTAIINPTTPPAENKAANKLRKNEPQVVKNDSEQQPDESLATVPVVEKTEETVNANDYSILVNTPEKKVEEPAEEEVKPKARPVNIRRQVNVRANNYRQMAFGGVKDLELTVNNDSKFALDKVVVELQYLKPSEQPIKTERVVFNSIGAGDSKTLRIPDYLRGVKIAYRVLDIESSQHERQTAGL